MTGTNELRLLDLMLEDLEHAPVAYKPTNFWASELSTIIDELRTHGVETFRRHPSARMFYAPTYATGSRKQRFSSNALARVDQGRSLAEKIENRHLAEFDYRLVKGLDPDGRLLTASESTFGQPAEQFVFDGRRYSRSFLNYLRGLVFFKRLVPGAQLETVVELGGGYGTLGEILTQTEPSITYVDSDIPPVAFVATCYLRHVFGAARVADYSETRESDKIDLGQLRRDGRSAVVPSWQFPNLVGSIDLFANFISFQEMEPDVVRNYVAHVQDLGPRWVLLRNQRDGKPLATKPGDIGVFEPVTRQTYIDAFSEYDVLGIDSTLFGDEQHGQVSEVMVLARR